MTEAWEFLKDLRGEFPPPGLFEVSKATDPPTEHPSMGEPGRVLRSEVTISSEAARSASVTWSQLYSTSTSLNPPVVLGLRFFYFCSNDFWWSKSCSPFQNRFMFMNCQNTHARKSTTCTHMHPALYFIKIHQEPLEIPQHCV